MRSVNKQCILDTPPPTHTHKVITAFAYLLKVVCD